MQLNRIDNEKMGKPKVKKDVLDWFDQNYSESRDECERLILEAERTGFVYTGAVDGILFMYSA